jgi:uncharacterized membrane protein YjgN (DUF898 family)
MGSCQPASAASLPFIYRTPSMCSSAGEYNDDHAAPAWLAIIPLLLIFAYVINAIIVCVVAKKRGASAHCHKANLQQPYQSSPGLNPCAWFFIAVM